MRHRLAAWASGATVDAVSRMPGHSGLSYGFSLDGEELVIRVPPLGVKRSGTTDVLRQVPLLHLLDAHGVPVPRVRFSGDDQRWFGTPYLIVERVSGAMPGDIFDGRRPAASRQERDTLFDQGVDALVAIHGIDPAPLPDGWATPVVLPDLIDHWMRLLERCEDTSRSAGGASIDTALIEAGRELHGLLRASVPDTTAPGLVHGDFYQNNWMASGSTLTAVLDWESAHLGPAAIDAGYLAMMYDAASWDPALRTDLVDEDRPELLLARYEHSSGRALEHPGWFRALAGLRLGTLTAYFLRLHRTGRRPDATWETIGPSAAYMFRRATELVRTPGRG